MASFGWIPPTREHRRLNMRYSIDLAELEEPPASFEKELPVPWEYYSKLYNQGNTPQCVGYSGSWAMSIDAKIAGMDKLFKATWLYQKACKIGGTNNGAYMWAGCKALEDYGHVEIVNGVAQPPDIEDGIKSYVWATSYRDIRAAIWNDRMPWFGMPWYWNNPTMINGEAWIGTTWGRMLGGHAITGFEWSDRRNAAALVQTWGDVWPRKTWISANAIQKILTQLGGECAITLDRYVAKPPPEPEPEPEADSITLSGVDALGKKWTGTLNRQ